MAECGTEAVYSRCVAEFGSALNRLAWAYEADADLRQDLLQEIHTALWRSLAGFDHRCALRTWVYRVAHNTAAAYVVKRLRHRSREWMSLDAAAAMPAPADEEAASFQRLAAERLMVLVQRLRPTDKQLVLLYLEGLDAASIAAVAGLSVTNVTTKLHRIKTLLGRQFQRRGAELSRHVTGATHPIIETRRPAIGLAAESAGRDQPVDGESARPRGAYVPVEEPA